MALATQCPHCQTTFRVAHDQLKLRAGLVRCGACKQIFNGIENLLRVDDTAQPPSEPAAQPSSHTAATQEAATAPLSGPVTQFPAAGLPSSSTDTRPMEAAEAKPDNPMLRMTLLDFAHVPRKASAPVPPSESGTTDEADDSVEKALEDLQRKPWRKAPDPVKAEDDPLDRADAIDYEEPAFVREARRKQRRGEVLKSTMGVGSLLLILILLGQAAYAFRDRIAAHFPSAQPALIALCGAFGCKVGLPARIDTVSIESNELQSLRGDDDTFALTVLLRNQGSTVESWPHIELTLNDSNEQPLLRRVFTPRDYLPAGRDLTSGFAARSEQPLKLYFKLDQVRASGYRVYLFYP